MSLFKHKWVKRLTITATFVIIALLCIKRKDMTLRQSMMKAFYSIIMLKGKVFGTSNGILLNEKKVAPTNSIYNLQFTANLRKIPKELFKKRKKG